MHLSVIYRLTDITSTNASPIYWDNKFRLNEICLRSFVEAFKDVNPHVYMIIDRSPDFYSSFVKQIVPFSMDIEFTNSGVRENAVHQYDYLKDDDVYYFLECDYLHLPGSGQKMMNAVKYCDFLSPYDHPDKYKEGMIPPNIEYQTILNQKWRTTDSTTSTFMARGEMVKKELDLFRSYGWDDHKRWLDLGSKGYKLWTPLPSLATHMVEAYMAPNIDWNKEINKYL